MLTGIVVENYRVFEDEIAFELKPLTILTGPNNSGKSSVLNVIDILNYIFNERDSLRKLAEIGISEKIFVELFGGFENLFSQNSEKNYIKFGFLWYSKQLRTELRYEFTFSKNRKLLCYSINEKNKSITVKLLEYINKVENLVDHSIRIDPYIQINYARLNELIYEMTARENIKINACIILVKEIEKKYGSDPEKSGKIIKYDKYFQMANIKFKEILKERGKIKFEYIEDLKHIIRYNNTVYILNEFHHITKKEFNKYFKNINECFELNDVINGTTYTIDNPIIEHLKEFDKCTLNYVDENGNTYNLIDNIGYQLNNTLIHIEKNDLNDILEIEAYEFIKQKLDPIIKKNKTLNDIDIEIELSANFFKNGLNYFDEDEGIFQLKYYDETLNKENSLTENDIQNLINEGYENLVFSNNFVGIDVISIDLNREENYYLYNLFSSYYPSKIEHNPYPIILLNTIFFRIVSEIKFQPDFDLIDLNVLFSSVNEDKDQQFFEDIVNINLGSIYNIGSFIFGIDIEEFIEKIKKLKFEKNKKIFSKKLLLNYAEKLLNHNLKKQITEKDKCILVEIFIFLFKKNISLETLDSLDSKNIYRKIIKDLNGYMNPKRSNKFSEYQGTHFTILNNFLKDYCLEFKWINEDLTNSFISHNKNITISRNNHFQMENELSRLMNIYAFIDEESGVRFGSNNNSLTEKECILESLIKYLKTFEIADNVEIEVIKNINTYNIYLMSNGRKTLLQDNGYGIIQIFSTLLFFALSNNPNTHYRNFFTYRYIIKEPESNLHPALQSKLGNIFCDFIKYDYNSNRKLLIETHSEYLIRKIQTLVAKKELDKDKVIIYYISQKQKLSKDEPLVKKININERGVMSEPFGSGFFDESDSIVGELLEIRLSQKN